jgi:O-antigen/teichoic acid export membrane protein
MELVIAQNRNRNMVLSLLGSLSSFILGMGINFFLTPFIVRTLGVEANGFLGLANNFINYFSLVTIALHSMAGRFITLKICNDEMEEAAKYFNSLFISNIVLSIFVFFISLACVIHIEQLVKVPVNLVMDVKLTFAVTFVNYIIQILTTVFSIAFFSTNKLYLQSLRLIQANLLRVAIILMAFMLFRPKIVYVAIGTIASGIFVLFNDIHYTKKLLPEIKVDHRQFEFAKVKELLASGVWNVVSKVGDILASGLDLLVSNIFIGATAMGVLAISKTVPNVLLILLYSVAGVFSPEMTILYGQKRSYELEKSIKQAMRLLCFFVSIPNGIFIIYGKEFFTLWQPTQDGGSLWILSVLAIISMFIIGPAMPLNQIFTITNKVYESSMVIIVYSVLSFAATLILLKTTGLGLYAIVGVSMAGSSLIALTYLIPRSAVLLGLKWHTFYKEVGLNIILSILVMAAGFAVKTIIPAHTWLTLIASGGITAILALILQWFVLLGKDTRKLIIQKVKSMT